MKYSLFLFDADDTLFDFRKSEVVSFKKTLEFLSLTDPDSKIYQTYKTESFKLWTQLEQGLISKDFLRTERFRKTFSDHKLDVDALKASETYLELLSESVFLVEQAHEICEHLSGLGEIGIITNGIESVQVRRLEKSGLKPLISFMSVSESCGFAKPDVRFFEHSVKMAKSFRKESSLVIGDRIEADILGALNFGVSSCWFNPDGVKPHSTWRPNYEITRLSQIKNLIL